MSPASLPLLCGALLAAGAAASIWRGARDGQRRQAQVWAQAPLALLLYLALFPPVLHRPGNLLYLIAPGATLQQLHALPFGELRAALPDAPQAPGTERVPDLATALRLHPQVRGIIVVGSGLPPRDLPAAARLQLRFEAAPQQGLIALQAPATARLGQQWMLSGRVAEPGTHLELRDPAGTVVDSVLPDPQGRFRASAALRGEGLARFELRLIHAGRPDETVSAPVVVRGGTRLSVLALEGAPGPESKYWQRWAADAGLDLGIATSLTQGVALHQGQAQLTPDLLAAADLVMIDTRAWDTLPAAQKAALRAAVEQGLGLLLRADLPPAPATAADWASLGYRLGGTDAPREVVLDRALGLHERQAFTEAPVTVQAADAAALLSADDGEVLAWQRDLGRGRVGLLRLVDSYRLQLLGEHARYGTLWADLLAALARPQPRPAPGPDLPQQSWTGERSVLCGLSGAAAVHAPDSVGPVGLSVAADGCAGYWPARAGWHILDNAGGTWPFYVRAADDGAGLRAGRDRTATQWLAQDSFPEFPPSNARALPLPRWPFLLAWFVLTIALWAAERNNWNRHSAGAGRNWEPDKQA